MREMLESRESLYFRQENVVDLIIDEANRQIGGVITQTGQKFYARTVVLTTGTFGNGIIHIGDTQFGGGRSGERSSVGISAALERQGFEVGRLKTGTPPRLDGRTVDYSKLEIQYGDANPGPFSFMTDHLPALDNQMTCWIGYTNSEVHEVLKGGFRSEERRVGKEGR